MNVREAVLLAASVTEYVYVSAASAFVGLPDKTRVDLLNVTPEGNSGGFDRPYVYGFVPPVAAGRVFETRWPLGQI